MSRLTTLLLASLTLIISLACATLLGESDTDVPSAPAQPIFVDTPIPSNPEALTCPNITERIVDSNSPTYDSTDFDEGEEEIEAYLVTYIIDNDALTEPYYYDDIPDNLYDAQNDFATHQELWSYFATLIPYEFRPHVAEFTIFTDGQSNTLAAVAQTSDDARLWGLEIDYADSNDYFYFSFTMVHEFAHLLTLSPSQVPPSLAIFNNPDDEIYLEEISTCSTFHPGEGCSNPNSYINLFYDRFWFDIYDEWNEINLEEDEDLYYEKLDDFYYQYEDQFLTDYAATHPAEDIAESFGFFVFAERPAGNTIAEQKILFFYEFPELVELRTEIVNNLCVAFPQ